MILISCTYNTIIEQVKSWIINNCVNVSNYANLPACFKQGFSQSFYPPHTWTDIGRGLANYRGCLFTPTTTAHIDRYIPSVSSSTVTNDLNTFINSISIVKQNNIAAEDFINFINNIFSFCSTKVGYTSSFLNESTYIVYNTYANTYVYKEIVKGVNTDKIITSKDATDLVNLLFSVMKANLRSIPCTYTFSFNG